MPLLLLYMCYPAETQYFTFPFSVLSHRGIRVHLLSYPGRLKKNRSLYFRPLDVYRNGLKPGEPDVVVDSLKSVCNIFYGIKGDPPHREPLLPKTLANDCAMQDKHVWVTVCNVPALFYFPSYNAFYCPCKRKEEKHFYRK